MDVSATLRKMADTNLKRHKVYKDSPARLGRALAVFHPEGVRLNTAFDHDLFALWSALIGKLVRFVVSGFTHKDSIHDAAVYCAMIEKKMDERPKGKK